jgi:hypothetical protein
VEQQEDLELSRRKTASQRIAMETWKHLRAILLLPFMVTVVVPGVILWLTGLDTVGLYQSSYCLGR